MSTIQLVTHAFNRILPKRKLVALFTTVNPPFCQSYPHPNTAKVLKQVVICTNLILRIQLTRAKDKGVKIDKKIGFILVIHAVCTRR